jgi:hypothetical protein
MEETPARTVFEPRRRRAAAVLGALALLAGGCTGRYAGPRTLATVGALSVAGGSVAWAGGESLERNGHSGSALVSPGFVAVAVGLAAIVAAGGWMSVSVACHADPDCDEEEQCREIPAPPGGVPYKQCMAR